MKAMYVYFDDNGKIIGIANKPSSDNYPDTNEMETDISQVEDFILGNKNTLEYVVVNKNGVPTITKPQELTVPLSWKKYLRLYTPTTVMEDFDIFIDRNVKTIYINLTDKFLKELEDSGTVYNLGATGKVEVYLCDARNYKFVYYSMSVKPGDLFAKKVEPIKYNIEIPKDIVCMTKNIFNKTSFRIL